MEPFSFKLEGFNISLFLSFELDVVKDSFFWNSLLGEITFKLIFESFSFLRFIPLFYLLSHLPLNLIFLYSFSLLFSVKLKFFISLDFTIWILLFNGSLSIIFILCDISDFKLFISSINLTFSFSLLCNFYLILLFLFLNFLLDYLIAYFHYFNYFYYLIFFQNFLFQ